MRLTAAWKGQVRAVCRTWMLAILVTALGGVILPSRVAASPPARNLHRGPGKASTLAKVLFIYHGLSVQPPHKKRQQGKKNMKLYNQYFLQTQKAQKASIRFNDGTTLHMNQRTDALLRNPHVTYVQKGQVDEILAPGTSHRVATAAAVAAAIGTNFVVQVIPQGKGKPPASRFIVVHGAVQVSNPQGTQVVKTNQASVVLQNQAPQPAQPYPAQKAANWTGSLPPTKVGENVALDANGGQVVAFSSQYQNATQGDFWNANFIIDGRLDFGWATAPGNVSNEWVKIKLGGNGLQKITKILIDPAATHGDQPSSDLKDFEIWVSTTGTDDASFTKVVSGTCQQKDALQPFPLDTPTEAKYIELKALDNYGSPDWISVAELEAVSAAG